MAKRLIGKPKMLITMRRMSPVIRRKRFRMSSIRSLMATPRYLRSCEATKMPTRRVRQVNMAHKIRLNKKMRIVRCLLGELRIRLIKRGAKESNNTLNILTAMLGIDDISNQ